MSVLDLSSSYRDIRLILFYSNLTSLMKMTSALGVGLLLVPGLPVDTVPLPFDITLKWCPMSIPLISGNKNAVLVDALMTKSQASKHVD